jgi:predicted HTH transcriptional regulator
MTKADLINKLEDIEWEDFEVKEAKSEVPKSAWETVSAFSNTNGGWLIFGIKEQGKYFEITGVKNAEKIEQDFLTSIRGGKFNVQIVTRQKKYNFDGKTVLAFYTEVSAQKPIYYNSPINTFIRRGSADMRATKEEVDSMYRDQTFGTKTSETANGTSRSSINDISLNRFRDYLSRFNPGVSYNRYNENEFLEKLRIIEDDKCTYGGLLMFGKRQIIERHFPDFRIDLIEIPGTSYGNAKTRYTFRLDEYENLWEYYFECFARLKQKVDVQFRLTAEGFGQELSPGLDAIREALVNMLMHADYFSPGHSRIRIFNSHIEFFNFGGLPKPLTELTTKDISLPRNPIIAKLFRIVKLAENMGLGIDRINQNWELYNHTQPEYDIDFDSVIVKMFTSDIDNISVNEPRKITVKDTDNTSKEIDNTSKETSNTSKELIIQLIQEDKTHTAESLSKILGITEKGVWYHLNLLKKKGLIKHIGPTKKGEWIVLQ